MQMVVDASQSGVRLDVFVAACTKETRGTVQRSISEGLCTVNGRRVKAGYRLRAGDVVDFTVPKAPLTQVVAQAIPLQVVYEDEHLLVVDKQAGMVVHPAPGHDEGTLVNALVGLGYFRAKEGDLRPGIVHRIDKDTSGLLVVARTSAAKEKLQDLFARHDLTRQYLAIVTGRMQDSSGVFDTSFGRHPTCRLRFSSRPGGSRRAITQWQVEAFFGDAATLVRATLHTGRTHQVRVHFHDAGHSLLGDPLYRRPLHNAKLASIAKELGRQALHAAVLGFVHPFSKKPLLFESTPPEDFQCALAHLREAFGFWIPSFVPTACNNL